MFSILACRETRFSLANRAKTSEKQRRRKIWRFAWAPADGAIQLRHWQGMAL